jgi:hypothetical protein
MSLRSALVLLLALSIITFLAACGGNNGPGVTVGQPPPSGAFNNSNLNGTYVFSVSGEDLATDLSYAVVGSINANGGGGITGGTIDMNDPNLSAAVIAAPINNGGSYTIGQDGRGVITINNFTGNPFNQALSFDFVLQNSFHGLVIERDNNATGSGTIDSVTAGATPSGSYAFSFSGATFSNDDPFVTVGNFALTGSSITAGVEDFNANGVILTNSDAGYPLSGTISGEGTATSLTTTSEFGTLSFDVYPIDANHLKFIEVDAVANLSGDAFSEPATPTIPAGTLSFTLTGDVSGAPFAAGGVMVTSGSSSSGTIGSGSIEDYDDGGTVSSTSQPFTGTYTGSAGRFSVAVSSFAPATVASFVAYPSSGGIFLMETDIGQISSGAAYAQTAGATFAASQGYGLNLSGENFSSSTLAEVDDIAEFTASASGTTCNEGTTPVSSDTLTGVTDENSPAGTVYGQALCGQYISPDATGRLVFSYAANILNTGITGIAYTVDGTTFPFIETDTAQVSTGAFFEQNASATSPSVAKAHSMFVPAVIRPHASMQKKQTQK